MGLKTNRDATLVVGELLLDDQTPGADCAVESALGLEIQGHKAEPPVTLHVQGLDHAAAVGARPRRLLPPDHPLIFVAYEHQTHLYRFDFFFVKKKGLRGLICLAEFLLADRTKSV
ncbi:hypothetical protein Salat_0731700 [Sesamum alatum]|uniref:Uncharacterized protein n=1 Tax=Sesamum alatum TaxID=300844 RepID=A0AAE1YT94_9LAMI|nr:hypothetical protein Salat_0731700 [Sesamum alatum]